jgi:hypothetical protein
MKASKNLKRMSSMKKMMRKRRIARMVMMMRTIQMKRYEQSITLKSYCLPSQGDESKPKQDTTECKQS